MSTELEKTEESDLASVQPTSCANCGADLQASFCSICGQKKLSGRFTLRSSLSNFFSTISNIDRGLWHTVIYMFTKPEVVLKDYLSGATIRYFHPFRYLFLWLTLQVFVTLHVIDLSELQMQANGVGKEAAPAVMVETLEDTNNYIHIFNTISMPFLAWGLWMMFGRKRYHYGEQLIIASYTYGHAVFISLIFSFLYLGGNDLLPYTATLNFLISFAYMVYALSRFFKQNVFMVMLKAVFAYVIWFVGVFSIMIPYIIAHFAWSYYQDPEAFKEQFGKMNKAEKGQVEILDSTALPADTTQFEPE